MGGVGSGIRRKVLSDQEKKRRKTKYNNQWKINNRDNINAYMRSYRHGKRKEVLPVKEKLTEEQRLQVNRNYIQFRRAAYPELTLQIDRRARKTWKEKLIREAVQRVRAEFFDRACGGESFVAKFNPTAYQRQKDRGYFTPEFHSNVYKKLKDKGYYEKRAKERSESGYYRNEKVRARSRDNYYKMKRKKILLSIISGLMLIHKNDQ